MEGVNHLTVKRFKIFRVFKYAIYALLILNVYWFFTEESSAADVRFNAGVTLAQIIEAYAATIDTLAWVVLLLTFELETHVLHGHSLKKPVAWSLQTIRGISYICIVYAFYGYIMNLIGFNNVVPLPGVSDLCALGGSWSYLIELDEYVAITSANCQSFSSNTSFFQLPRMLAVIDAQGLAKSQSLAWVDVINAAAWLLVVLVLEIDVHLEKSTGFSGVALKTNNAIKIFLYLVLLMTAIFWGVNGHFFDFWDAGLWLIAFFFIELNFVEWRQEGHTHSA